MGKKLIILQKNIKNSILEKNVDFIYFGRIRSNFYLNLNKEKINNKLPFELLNKEEEIKENKSKFRYKNRFFNLRKLRDYKEICICFEDEEDVLLIDLYFKLFLGLKMKDLEDLKKEGIKINYLTDYISYNSLGVKLTETGKEKLSKNLLGWEKRFKKYEKENREKCLNDFNVKKRVFKIIKELKLEKQFKLNKFSLSENQLKLLAKEIIKKSEVENVIGGYIIYALSNDNSIGGLMKRGIMEYKGESFYIVDEFKPIINKIKESIPFLFI